jgi:hypothetical protein
VNAGDRYATPTAFRQALTDRLKVAATLDDALAVVRPLIDPLLDGTAAGRWDPDSAAWTQS